MRTKTVRALIALSFCFLIFTQPMTASAANQTKVLIGVGLIAGGIGLGAQAASNVLCSENCGGRNAEMVVALGMIGTGTYFLIKGLRQHSKNALERNPLKPTILFGVGPVKRGWAGGVLIKW